MKQKQLTTKKSDIDLGNKDQLNFIIEILQKDQSLKTNQEVDIVRKAFISFKFFQDLEQQMGQEMVSNLYRQLSYETIKARQVVFNLGDIGKKFYIILSGSVWVLIQKKGLQDDNQIGEEEKKQEEELRKQNTRKATLKHQQSMLKSKRFKKQETFVTETNQVHLDEVYAKMTDAEYLDCQFPTLQKVSQMKSGDNFGEIALTKQVPRTATIVAAEDTNFAIVSREQFNILLSSYYEHLQQQNVMFLQRVPAFTEWNEQMLNQIYYHFTFEDYKMFDVIYKENQPSNKIYIVQNGEIEISQSIEVGTLVTENNLTIQKFFKKNDKKYERVRTGIITSGLIFGHEEVIRDVVREHKAVCLSQKAQVFSLDKDRFLQFFKKGGAIQKLIKLDQTNYSRKSKSVSVLKEIKQFSPAITFREIPFFEEDDKISDFVIKKAKNAVDRVGNEPKRNGYEFLQGKGHINKAHYNFQKNLDKLKRNLKHSVPLNINTCLFELDSNKGTAISIMNKVFPSSSRPKYEIPKFSMTSRIVIKSLKLPKLLNEVEVLLFSNKESMISNSTTMYKQQAAVKDDE
ncbi:unnamed protein product (macronuclear) [Paramecium tetraurelia]|uniref:Cyclic nucleotide-binding domain-containing protein n=1 Tax=Paramecium tetraurelia TaxID=5888 RepID=A0DS25_PARTE|nr:uncharacterized protein GSPATT00019546001 [Paramecium tetraurelia]CAK85842.1 unnamed protein product [Paramecium tetraurelia]|eukprot:XP_001453239.1 hypothetical protein (macronuclear) [Paramecium tetraurelia strain d4-2]